ncbi:hypothetical protein Tco_0538285 [Tanacetum coccineum]
MSKALKQNEVKNLIYNERLILHAVGYALDGILMCFVYADNSGIVRKELWKELRSPVMTNDMQDFYDLVNEIEVDDIYTTGFFYTWTKSLRNPNNSIMKKLDRLMINEAFLKEFRKSHGMFLPYMVFDHSPTILYIPDKIPKKRKSFKFSNFVADKEEFMSVVKKGHRKEAVRIHEEYTEVVNDELKLLQQQAKIIWLSDGDKNTAFFHSTLKARRHK